MGFNKTVRRHALLCFLLAIPIICGFFVFWYSDIGDTLDNAVLLVESIAEGNFCDYYEYAALNSSPYSQYSANYNIFLYIIFAIWNLPTALLHLSTGFDYMADVYALLWCKSILLVSYVAIFIVIVKLVREIGGTRADGYVAATLSISSLSVFVPVLVASQYDCFSLLFVLLGLLFFTKKKTWLFLLMFAIAVPLKMFALFVFLPIVLIRYKNVLKILGMCVLVYLPSYLLELPFRHNKYYTIAMESQNADAIDLLFSGNLKIGSLYVNLFVIACIIICFLCYITRENDRVKEAQLSVYYCFAIFASFCILVPIRSYWIVLYTPFLAILAATKNGNRTIPIIIDTLSGVGAGLYFLASHWIYNTGYIASSLILSPIAIPEDGMEQKYGHFAGLLDHFELGYLKYAFFAVFIGSIVFALWYLHPRKNRVLHIFTERSAGEGWAMISRPIILTVVAGILLYCNFALTPAIRYGSAEYDKKSKTNLMYGSTATRTLTFDEDENLNELNVYLYSNAYRSARAFVGVRLIDTTDDSVIWDDCIGVTLIGDDKCAEFDLGGLSVKKDREYTLELYPITPELAAYGTEVSPYLDSDGKIAYSIR